MEAVKNDKVKNTIEFLEKFFAIVRDKKEFIEFRLISPEKPFKSFTPIYLLKRAKVSIEEFFRLNSEKNYNFYFSVATRKGRKGRKENVASLVAFWVDIDIGEKKFFKNREQALNHIKAVYDSFKIKPSIVINSGNGFHLYFLLDKPFEIREKYRAFDIEFFEQRARALQKLFMGDNVSDITRIMRIPFSLNIKGAEFKECEILECDWDNRYDLNVFSYIWEEVKTQLESENEEDKSIEDLAEVKVKLGSVKVKQGDLQKRVSDRVYKMITKQDYKDFYPSRSEMDFAVVLELINQGFSKEEIKYIFERYPIGEKYREKGRWGEDYLIRTIRQAEKFLNTKEAVAIIPMDFKIDFFDKLVGELTQEDIKRFKTIEQVVGEKLSPFFQEAVEKNGRECIKYEVDRGVYKQVLAFVKEEKILKNKIDLDLLKKIWAGLINEAVRKRSFIFKISFPQFVRRYFGEKALKDKKLRRTFEVLGMGLAYVLEEEGKFKLKASGNFISFQILNKRADIIQVVLNPLGIFNGWDLERGVIRGYTTLKLPFERKDRKNKLENYKQELREFLRIMRGKGKVFKIKVENLFKRLDVKEYELKRSKKRDKIWIELKKVIEEECIIRKIYRLDKNRLEDVRFWSLELEFKE